ncbi:monocarboxylate transporter 9-like [Arapaima gigas]
MEAQKSVKALDGGWGWVIMVASFMAQLLAYGSPHAVGVLFPEWLAAFHGGKALTAWVGSLVSGIGLLASPICSACVMNFGAKPVVIFSGVMVAGGHFLSAFSPNVQFLIFSYGIVVGLGCGLVYAATVTITCQYFDKRRGLALGFVTTGTSVGGFLYATLQVELIEFFGLQICLLIVGALSLNIIGCAGLMRPLHLPGYLLKQTAALSRTTETLSPPLEKPPAAVDLSIPIDFIEKTLISDGLIISVETEKTFAHDTKFLNNFSPKEVIKVKQQAYSNYINTKAAFLHNRVYLSLCMCLFLFSIGASPPVLFMEDVALSKGFTEGISIIPLVSIFAIGNCLGKLLLGMMVDLKWINSLYLYIFAVFGSGAALLLIPNINTYLGLQILSAVMGLGSGNWSITSCITTKIAGLESLTQAYGILMFFGGFGIILGPPVVGWFYDWSQSYDTAFYFSGSCVLLGAVTLLLSSLPCWDKYRKENLKLDSEDTPSGEKISSVMETTVCL